MDSLLYSALNKAWKSTCRVLFGEEVGELEGFEGWLTDYEINPQMEKSSISGKPVALPLDNYARGSKFISFDEVDFGKRFEPLSINEVKDIDSIVEAVGERMYYAGNIILGNSSFVQQSADVVNGSFIYNSSLVSDSKYVAHSIWMIESEYCFGQFGGWRCNHSIKGSGGEYTRCFECHSGEVISDCYYSGSLKDCTNCMFSFGAQNRSYLIGNLEFPKERYMQLKAKLVGEIAQTLKKDKEIFSLFHILQEAEKYGHPEYGIEVMEKKKSVDKKPIEKAFASASSILLGKPLEGIDSYSKFLSRHIPMNVKVKSHFSGQEVTIAGYRASLIGKFEMTERFLTELGVREIGKKSAKKEEIEKMHASLDSVCRALHSIAYSDLDKQYGENTNIFDGSVVVNAHDCYVGSAYSHCKKCAYCFWPLNGEHIFGSYQTWNSQFCMKTYNSKRLVRCFEVDCSHDCADAYFSHNCENVNEGMFCFNAKNLRNAIGNAEMEKEKYRGIKKSVLSQISDELEKKKDLKWDIFAIGRRH